MATNGFRKTTREAARPVCFIEPIKLKRQLGLEVTLASETFQLTGSFKFRAAYELASSVSEKEILTASSGNFGQAMAYACLLLQKKCTVVMPNSSAKVKIEAVRDFGGTVDLIDTQVITRKKRVQELALMKPEAFVASAYDDPRVINGNATLGDELLESGRPFDTIVVPIGGGGLSSGIIQAYSGHGKKIRVIGAEPELGNDAARSLVSGRIIANVTEPATLADGARTLSLGNHNWTILEKGLATIVEVPEKMIAEAVRLLFQLANLKAEPTGALGLAAILTRPDLFQGCHPCVVITGGNVDTLIYREILEGIR